jgi:hypothetical protein
MEDGMTEPDGHEGDFKEMGNRQGLSNDHRPLVVTLGFFFLRIGMLLSGWWIWRRE